MGVLGRWLVPEVKWDLASQNCTTVLAQEEAFEHRQLGGRAGHCCTGTPAHRW